MHLRLGIIAMTRSGTSWMEDLLQKTGVRVLHEHFGEEGCVGFNLAFDMDEVIGDETNPRRPGRRGYTFDHLWHQVRHPLPTIASLHTHNSGLWRMIRHGLGWQHGHRNLVLRGARYWLEFNRLAETIARWRYRIETVGPGTHTWHEICRRLGLSERWPQARLDVNSKRRYPAYREISWRTLRREAPQYYRGIARTARRYGYEDAPDV